MVGLARLYSCGHGEHGGVLEAGLRHPGRRRNFQDRGGECTARKEGSGTQDRRERCGMVLCHGLLRSSFVPPKPIRELRDLTRYRRKLVESQVAERNRLLKLLESANIKLASVAADVFGLSGQLMLRALIEGKASPQEMAELAKGRMRAKIPELEPALEGKLEEHHRFLLRLQLQRLNHSSGKPSRTIASWRSSGAVAWVWSTRPKTRACTA